METRQEPSLWGAGVWEPLTRRPWALRPSPGVPQVTSALSWDSAVPFRGTERCGARDVPGR